MYLVKSMLYIYIRIIMYSIGFFINEEKFQYFNDFLNNEFIPWILNLYLIYVPIELFRFLIGIIDITKINDKKDNKSAYMAKTLRKLLFNSIQIPFIDMFSFKKKDSDTKKFRGPSNRALRKVINEFKSEYLDSTTTTIK
eukprot:UN34281